MVKTIINAFVLKPASVEVVLFCVFISSSFLSKVLFYNDHWNYVECIYNVDRPQETTISECCICDEKAKMTHDPSDPRVLRTHQLLKDALITLSAERGFDGVTVGDIVRRAKINRATFYRHYSDKYALVEEIFQEAMDRMRRDIKPPSVKSLSVAMQDPPERLVKLFEHFAENKHLYLTLLGGSGSSWFTAKMRSQITDFLEQREQILGEFQVRKYDTDAIDMPKKVGLALASNLLLSTITWWLDNGIEYSPRQMAAWFIEFVVHGYVRILGL